MRAPVARSCEHGKQALRSIKCKKLIDYTDGGERSPKDDANDRVTDFPPVSTAASLPFRSAVTSAERVCR